MRFLVILLPVALVAQQQVQFSYDRAGRLIRADYGGGKVISYTYDAAGNLLRSERNTEPVFTSVNSASLKIGPIAPDSIVSGYGAGLASGIVIADTNPPPTELGGTRVEVTDSRGVTRPAGLFFVSPQQINYLLPRETALGAAQVRVINGGNTVPGTIQVEEISPAVYTANSAGTGVAAAFYLRINPDGSRAQDLLFDPPTRASVPVDLGPAGSDVYLLMFGTGIRGIRVGTTAIVGGIETNVLGAVPQGQYAGEDQVNIGPLPRQLAGRGEVDIVLRFDGQPANTVKVNIK